MKFLQNDAGLAFVQPYTSPVASGHVCSTLDKVKDAGIDHNAFQVRLFYCDGGVLEDRDFALMLP